jgi:hypothetical protein
VGVLVHNGELAQTSASLEQVRVNEFRCSHTLVKALKMYKMKRDSVRNDTFGAHIFGHKLAETG